TGRPWPPRFDSRSSHRRVGLYLRTEPVAETGDTRLGAALLAADQIPAAWLRHLQAEGLHQAAALEICGDQEVWGNGDALTVGGGFEGREGAVELGGGAPLHLRHAGRRQPDLPFVGGGVELQQGMVHEVGGLAQAEAGLRRGGAADGDQAGVEEM